jgi:signal peptidase II
MNWWLLFGITSTTVSLDLLSKEVLATKFHLGQSIPLVPGILNLVHVRNKGVAFGLLSHPSVSWLLPYLGVLLIVGLILFVFYLRPKGKMAITSMGLTIGGAIGNLYDRLYLKEVRDFFDLHIGSYHWPAFNVADTAITIGAILFLLHVVRSKDDDKKMVSKGS